MSRAEQIKRHTSRRRLRAWLVGGAISVLLLGAVLWQVDPQAIARFATAVNPIWLGVAFLAYVLANLLSCARLVRSLRRPGTVADAMDITVVHGALLALLPARLGDAYYPVLLSRRLGVGLGTALGNLLLLRLLDGLTVALMFVLAAAALGKLAEGQAVAAAAGAVAVVMTAALVVAPWALGKTAECLVRSRMSVARRLLKPMLEARRWLRRLPVVLRMELLAWTLLIWASAFLCLGLILRALGGAALAVWDVIFVGAGLNLAAALPIQTVGGFGLAEATLAGLMTLVGLPLGEAAALGLLSRLAWLMMPFALAGAWLGLRRIGRLVA